MNMFIFKKSVYFLSYVYDFLSNEIFLFVDFFPAINFWINNPRHCPSSIDLIDTTVYLFHWIQFLSRSSFPYNEKIVVAIEKTTINMYHFPGRLLWAGLTSSYEH